MTDIDSPIHFLGKTYDTICGWDQKARQATGYQLSRLQAGQLPNDWKPMTSIGIGVKEIRIHLENEYRVIYLAENEHGIYVLHAFIKKDQKTPKTDIKRARENLATITPKKG